MSFKKLIVDCKLKIDKMSKIGWVSKVWLKYYSVIVNCTHFFIVLANVGILIRLLELVKLVNNISKIIKIRKILTFLIRLIKSKD